MAAGGVFDCFYARPNGRSELRTGVIWLPWALVWSSGPTRMQHKLTATFAVSAQGPASTTTCQFVSIFGADHELLLCVGNQMTYFPFELLAGAAKRTTATPSLLLLLVKTSRKRKGKDLARGYNSNAAEAPRCVRVTCYFRLWLRSLPPGGQRRWEARRTGVPDHERLSWRSVKTCSFSLFIAHISKLENR